MITSTVVYEGNLRTRATHQFSQNEIFTDAPIDNNGKGQAFSPTDLLATSLSSCMLTIIGIIANREGFSIDGTKSEVTKIMASEPRRVSEIQVKFYFPKNNYSEKEIKIIQNAAMTCPVAKSIHPEIKQNIEFHF